MLRFVFSTMLTICVLQSPIVMAQDYSFDPAHSAVGFQASHMGISWTPGRFNKIDGEFSIASEPSKSTFVLTIPAESLDTGNAQRDDHLRGPDFFNVKQFPAITFKSTAVRESDEGLEVVGNFTLHGVTKPIVLVLKGGKTAEFPAGTKRIGYSGSLTVKRSDYGMGNMLQAVGDDVRISFSFEGIQK